MASIDLAIGLCCCIILFPVLLFAARLRRNKAQIDRPRLLAIWTGHSYKSIITYNHLEVVLQQNCKGFFEHVFILYPILGANPIDRNEHFPGIIRKIDFAPGFTFIESRINTFSFLKMLPLTNFICSQVSMIFKMAVLIKNENVSVVKAFDPFLTGLYALLLGRIRSIPFAMRVGSNFDLLYQKNHHVPYGLVFRSYRISRLIGRFVLKRCNLIMPATENYYQYCIRNGAKKENTIITRFGNLVDDAHRTPPKERTKPVEKLAFLDKHFGIYVGRLAAEKNAGDLVDITYEIVKIRKEATLVVIGDGNLLDSMKERAKQLSVANSLIFLGKKNQEYIAQLLPMATAFIATHGGRSLMEAAYAGIPLLAYDWEWHGELVIPGQTGELVPFGDCKAMANSFCKMVDDHGYALTLGKNARILALDILDKQKILEIEKNAYRGLLTGKS